VIRIAIVAPSLRILGGQSVQADRLLTLMRQDGADVRFLAVDPALPRSLRWVRRVPYLRTLVNQLCYLPGLLRLIAADVVHVFSASYWSFLLAPAPAMLAARLFGKRVVLHYHSGEADDHLQHWGWRVHPWLKLAHEIVVPSRYLAQVFANHGYHTRVIPNVIEVTRFRRAAASNGGRRLLSVRNLEPIYRVDVLIDAFAILRRKYPDATLTVAGVGSQAAALRQRVRDASADGVEFVGRVEPADMPELYCRGDVFLNASVVDNQPVSILEAFASGLPVITTPTGDIAWMVRDGETGVIVAEPDPLQFADAIESLFEDPERGARVAREAAAQLERHTWPAIRLQWQQVYAPHDVSPGAVEALNS
jgi:glycosyltransferase involved in cell wall biosynthesis